MSDSDKFAVFVLFVVIVLAIGGYIGMNHYIRASNTDILQGAEILAQETLSNMEDEGFLSEQNREKLKINIENLKNIDMVFIKGTSEPVGPKEDLYLSVTIYGKGLFRRRQSLILEGRSRLKNTPNGEAKTIDDLK